MYVVVGTWRLQFLLTHSKQAQSIRNSKVSKSKVIIWKDKVSIFFKINFNFKKTICANFGPCYELSSSV